MQQLELADGVLKVAPFLSFTLGIIVLFVGGRWNARIGFLREFSIPEAVTGGLLFSVLFAIVYAATGVAVEFDLAARDLLLVYFFTTIGINASFKDLLEGGKPLLVLLVITIAYMFVQNLTGISVAALFDLSAPVGLLGGTVSLVGGHGTAIAWAPRIAADYGVSNAMEIGIACATFGLIFGSLMGGPIAKFLITRHDLTPDKTEPLNVGLSEEDHEAGIGSLDFLDAILAIHISILFGLVLNAGVQQLGLQLPLFVPCLFAGILITNLIPAKLPAHYRKALACSHDSNGCDRRHRAGHLPGDVTHEHAALDTGRSGRADLHHPRGPGRRGGNRQHLHRLPGHGQELRRSRHLFRVWRHIPGLDARRNGQHVRGDPALRRLASRLHHRAPGMRVLHRPG